MISPLDSRFLAEDGRSNQAERKVEEGTGMDVNNGTRSRDPGGGETLDRTPWGLKLWPLIRHQRETRVGYLAELLSNKWLGERHIDTLVAYLGNQLQKSCHLGTTFIADHSQPA